MPGSPSLSCFFYIKNSWALNSRPQARTIAWCLIAWATTAVSQLLAKKKRLSPILVVYAQPGITRARLFSLAPPHTHTLIKQCLLNFRVPGYENRFVVLTNTWEPSWYLCLQGTWWVMSNQWLALLLWVPRSVPWTVGFVAVQLPLCPYKVAEANTGSWMT